MNDLLRLTNLLPPYRSNVGMDALTKQWNWQTMVLLYNDWPGITYWEYNIQ